MARPKAFDENMVLVGAMHAFRRSGYSGVSIKDLEQATGLKSGSIYNSYGDKDGLFRAALGHYNLAVVRGRLEMYATEAAGIAGLRRLFLSLLREPDGGSNGCLLTNSAIEFGSGASIARDGVRQGFDLLRQAFVRVLTRAREQGKLSRDIDIDAAALKHLVLYQGLLVLIRCGRDTSDLARLIEAEFDQLEGRRNDP